MGLDREDEGLRGKTAFLEPLICAVQRRPDDNEDLLIFLMLVFEPVRRAVSKIFINVHSGLQPVQKDLKWTNREEIRLIEHVERQDLFDVTREAALEALYQFPYPPPDHFFRWLREAIAHRALNKIRGDLPRAATTKVAGEEAEAIQMALAGFERLDAPTVSDRGGARRAPRRRSRCRGRAGGATPRSCFVGRIMPILMNTSFDPSRCN